MQAAIERPRFRQDLVAEPIDDQAGKFIDVMDPDSGNVFRFYEVEFSIACAMDGERDIAGIVQWAKEELGLSPSPTEVRSVVATLGELGYLDQSTAARAAAAEAPARGAAPDTALAPGIVVGAQPKAARGVDVELGKAGTTAPAAGAAMPKAPDLDLGAPGAPASAKQPRPTAEDVTLGAPGRVEPSRTKTPEISPELAATLAVQSVSDKEAARASKPEAKPAPVAATAEPAAAKPAVVEPAAKAEPAKAEKAAKAEPAKPEKAAAAEKPVAAKAEKAAAVPTAPRSGISPTLIVLLVLVIVGAGAYLGWRYLLRDKAPTAETPAATAPISQESPVAPEPPKPPEPTAKIEIASGEPRDVISAFAGTIESIDPAERDVESSAVIARLVGAKRLETELAALTKELETKIAKQVEAATAAQDKAQAANNAAGVKAAEAQLAKLETLRQEKQDLKLKKEDDLEKLLVRAPFDGQVTVLAKAGQKLDENTVVAKMVPRPAPSAMFKLEKNMTIERGLAVPVAVGEKLYTCTVAESTVDGTRVVCPEDPALTPGTEVRLKGVE